MGLIGLTALRAMVQRRQGHQTGAQDRTVGPRGVDRQPRAKLSLRSGGESSGAARPVLYRAAGVGLATRTDAVDQRRVNHVMVILPFEQGLYAAPAFAVRSSVIRCSSGGSCNMIGRASESGLVSMKARVIGLITRKPVARSADTAAGITRDGCENSCDGTRNAIYPSAGLDNSG